MAGSHRGRKRLLRELLPYLAVCLVAVGIVVGVIAVVDAVNGSKTGGGSPAVVGPPVSAVSSGSPSSSLGTPLPSTSSPAATPTTAAPRTTPPPAVATPAPAATPVQVFNVSRRSGLAQTEANRLRAAGYPVTRVANKKGVSLATTTVYFEAGNAASQAAANGVVARGLAAVAAARPGSIPATGTLIVYVAG